MPTSNLALWPTILNLVHQVEHHRVLDVGPGWGKAAVLLREYLNEPPDVIHAVEAWAPYVGDHQLACLYGQVLVADVCNLDQDLLGFYDLVLMVDVLEHLDLEAGHSLLARIPGRVVVCTPVDFFSNGPGLPPSEEHRSHWTGVQWDRVAEARKVEYLDQYLGGWLARLAPL